MWKSKGKLALLFGGQTVLMGVLMLLVLLTSELRPSTRAGLSSLAFRAQGNRCVFNLCRGCCKKRAFRETADCPGEQAPAATAYPPSSSSENFGFLTPILLSPFLSGHGLLFKTKLEKSLAWKGIQPGLQEAQQVRPVTPSGFSEVMGSALA